MVGLYHQKIFSPEIFLSFIKAHKIGSKINTNLLMEHTWSILKSESFQQQSVAEHPSDKANYSPAPNTPISRSSNRFRFLRIGNPLPASVLTGQKKRRVKRKK